MNEIITKGLLYCPGGPVQARIKDKIKSLDGMELIRIDQKHSKIFANLKAKLEKQMGIFNATAEEIDLVYNHIIMELLS